MRQVEVTIGHDIVAETVDPRTTVLQLSAAALQLANLPAEPLAQVELAATVDGQFRRLIWRFRGVSWLDG